MAENLSFQEKQYAFTAHIRDPEAVSAPADIEDRRMAIYRDLFFNNVNGFLENSFPILHSIYEPEAWTRLARSFFSTHQSHSPYFIDISKEFLLYLQEEHKITADDPAYLLDLAHFEWAEIALMVDQEEPEWNTIDRNGNLLEGTPILSPVAYCLAYQWPVHEINVNNQPEIQPETPSFILIYQDDEGDVKYMGADPITARIMELLQQEEPTTGRAILTQLAKEMQHPDEETAIHSGYSILLKLHHANILLGTQK